MTTNNQSALAIQVANEIGEKGWNAKYISTVFSTIAPACKTAQEMKIYLERCRILGIEPISGGLKALPFLNKKTGVETVHYTVSADELASWLYADGWILTGAAVHDKDEWGGWDAVDNKPIKHVVTGKSKLIIGAWARAVEKKTGFSVGQYWPASELVNDRNPLYNYLPSHMHMKCAKSRVARMAVPKRNGIVIYSTEEIQAMSGTVELQPSDPQPMRDVTASATVSSANATPAPEPAAPPSDPKAHAMRCARVLSQLYTAAGAEGSLCVELLINTIEKGDNENADDFRAKCGRMVGHFNTLLKGGEPEKIYPDAVYSAIEAMFARKLEMLQNS